MLPNGPSPQFIGIADAAQTLAVSRATLYRLIDAGRIERVNLNGKALIPMHSLNALIAGLRDETKAKKVG